MNQYNTFWAKKKSRSGYWGIAYSASDTAGRSASGKHDFIEFPEMMMNAISAETSYSKDRVRSESGGAFFRSMYA
jgi:hypothetical protein